MDYVARLFGEAWERRRRRRRTIAWTGLALAVGVIMVAYAIVGGGPAPPMSAPIPKPPGTVTLTSSRVFSQPPYMGVHCRVPNSIACDEVGLAIWLKRPAYSVRAAIDGRTFAMNRFGDLLASSRRPRTAFDGYLQPAGIETAMHVRPSPGTSFWAGDPTAFATVWLLIDYGSGRYVATHLRVPLMAGWG